MSQVSVELNVFLCWRRQRGSKSTVLGNVSNLQHLLVQQGRHLFDNFCVIGVVVLIHELEWISLTVEKLLRRRSADFQCICT